MTDRLTKEREEEIRAALERWPDERLLWEEYSHDLLAELDATRNELRTAQERLERQEATIAELRRERDEARRSLDLSVQAWDATGGPREGMLALIQRAEGAEAQLAALRRERDDARLQLRELEAEVAADLDGSQAAQAVVDAQAGERAALDRAEAAEARVMELTQGRDEALKALDEREGDMHARIRAGYDHTVADMWRAKVAEVEARAAAVEAQLAAFRVGTRPGSGIPLTHPPGQPTMGGVAGDHCGPGNECGRLGCEDCQS